jgi:hypothetical protein
MEVGEIRILTRRLETLYQTTIQGSNIQARVRKGRKEKTISRCREGRRRLNS